MVPDFHLWNKIQPVPLPPPPPLPVVITLIIILIIITIIIIMLYFSAPQHFVLPVKPRPQIKSLCCAENTQLVNRGDSVSNRGEEGALQYVCWGLEVVGGQK